TTEKVWRNMRHHLESGGKHQRKPSVSPGICICLIRRRGKETKSVLFRQPAGDPVPADGTEGWPINPATIHDVRAAIGKGTSRRWIRQVGRLRSEEHTSDLQSRENLVCT